MTLYVTFGDPLSINVDIFLQAWRVHGGKFPAIDVHCVGHWENLVWQCKRLKVDFPPVLEKSFVDIGPNIDLPADWTRDEAYRGWVATQSLEHLKRVSSEGLLAVLTLPIDKYVARQAGFAYPGHTEFFETQWQGQGVMTLGVRGFWVGLVTNHVPLHDVSGLIDSKLVAKKLRLFGEYLERQCGRTPRIGVLGLNPHASDGGLFGEEEARSIQPAIREIQRSTDWHISGPLPSDTAFYQMRQGCFDGVLAMYHDQGLGPLKTLYFDEAVNVTAGLKHLRVSPDHGPATDLFLTGLASSASCVGALELAGLYLAGESIAFESFKEERLVRPVDRSSSC